MAGVTTGLNRSDTASISSWLPGLRGRLQSRTNQIHGKAGLGDRVIHISDPAVAALKAGNKVAAVKITRETQRVSLREALDAVDDYLVSNPDVRDMFLRMHKETNRPLSLAWRIGMILLLAGLIAEYLAR